MKKQIIFCTVLTTLSFLSTMGFGQTLSDLYAENSRNRKVQTLNIGSGMLRVASIFVNDNDQDLKDVLKSIDNIRVMITEDELEGKDISNKANQILNNMDYEELIRLIEEDEVVRILSKQESNEIQELIILVSDASETILLQFNGNIELSKVSAALDAFNIDVDIDEALKEIN